MSICFNGYGESVATFDADNTVEAGMFVVMDENYSVKAASEGDEVFGYCLSVRDGCAAVQLEGYVEAPVSGEISLGSGQLAAASATAIAQGESGPYYKVVYVTDGVVGFIL